MSSGAVSLDEDDEEAVDLWEKMAVELVEQVKAENAQRKEEIHLERVEDAVEALMRGLEEDEEQKAVRAVLFAVDNIVAQPDDERFRRFSLENEGFRKRIGRFAAALEFLYFIGFVVQGDSIVLHREDLNVDKISVVAALLRERVEQILPDLMLQPRNQIGKPMSSTLDSVSGEKHESQESLARLRMQKARETLSKHKVSTDQLKKMHMERLRRQRLGIVPNLSSSRNQIPNVQRNRKQEQSLDISNEEPPSLQLARRKREFTLRDIEELRKQDLLKSVEKQTSDSYLDRLGQDCLNLTNEFRKEHGLKPLHWHQGLANIGKVHSARMGTFEVPVGHDGFSDRVKKYPFVYESAAENVAMVIGHPVSSTPRLVVQGWINSP